MLLLLLPPLFRSPSCFKGNADPPHPTSAVHAHAPLLSALIPQNFKPTIQPSATNPPTLTQILDLHLQKDVPHLQNLATHATNPPLSVLLQGQGHPPLLYSAVPAYVPLTSALIIWKSVTLCQT